MHPHGPTTTPTPHNHIPSQHRYPTTSMLYNTESFHCPIPTKACATHTFSIIKELHTPLNNQSTSYQRASHTYTLQQPKGSTHTHSHFPPQPSPSHTHPPKSFTLPAKVLLTHTPKEQKCFTPTPEQPALYTDTPTKENPKYFDLFATAAGT